MAQKIVVTGGSGRLGQYVIRELLDYDYDVLSLDRVTPPTEICPSRIVDLTHAEARPNIYGARQAKKSQRFRR